MGRIVASLLQNGSRQRPIAIVIVPHYVVAARTLPTRGPFTLGTMSHRTTCPTYIVSKSVPGITSAWWKKWRAVSPTGTQKPNRFSRKMVATIAFTRRLRNEKVNAPVLRAQQGRPSAWCPSSVRAILHRPAYLGQVVYGKTAARDQWGQSKVQKIEPEKWITRADESLRIIDDKLWAQAHARLQDKADAYLRGTKGHFNGKPRTGSESKYLLPGLAKCALCGHGMIVRTRSHGRQRAHFLGCSGYHLRGTTVCGNRTEDALARIDASVLSEFAKTLGAPDLLDAVVDVAKRRLAPAVANVTADITGLRAALVKIEGEIRNLTDAIASGVGLSSVVTALRKREDERATIRRRIEAVEQGQTLAASAPSRLRDELAGRLADWRGVLLRNPVIARQVLKKLLDGPLLFTPKTDGSERWFEFEGRASVAKMLGNMDIYFGGVPNGS